MANNLAEVYKETAQKYGEKPAFFSKDEKKSYKPVSFKFIHENGIALAEELINMGVNARDNIGLMADHRTEWPIVDCGILSVGAADVPRGTDVTESELEYILNHSESKIVFVEHDKMLDKLNSIKSKIPNVKTVIVMDPKAVAQGALKLKDVIDRGKVLRDSGSQKVEARIKQIKDTDLFTLIYTSGTTGQPKGVMLTHKNMLSIIEIIEKFYYII
jgi:long-chain acyl-CoA synthetase